MATEAEIVELLDGLTLIASRAAAAILAVPRLELNRRDKLDASPVTAADDASETVILAGLARLLPGVPVVSEESTGHRPIEGLGLDQRFVIVDPLDGTREFIAGLDEYSVNIALIENGTPVMGVIAAPASGVIWRGQTLVGEAGQGAERFSLAPGAALPSARQRIAIHTRPRAAVSPRVLVSRSYPDPATNAYVDRLPRAERVVYGSSLKFCLLAEGLADVYPRLGPISEWDIAAGHALLVAAGGAMHRPDGSELRYGQNNFLVRGFIASGDAAAA